MYGGLVLIVLVGGLQALHTSLIGTAGNWIDPIIAVLIALEHTVNGNINSTPTV